MRLDRSFMLVAGLRPVKDVLYLVDAMERLHDRHDEVHFFLIGPRLDKEYSGEVTSRLGQSDGVHLLDCIPQGDLQRALQEVCGLVNSSRSEGMCGAICEAMCLGTPVIARDIPGNTALVRDGETGLLFSDPGGFERCVEDLLTHPALRQQLAANAQAYMRDQQSTSREEELYRVLQKSLMN